MRSKRSSVIEEIVEYTYKTKVKYMCPHRGPVEEEIEVKRYKATPPPKGSILDVDSLEHVEVDEKS